MDNPATVLIELRKHYRNLLAQHEREAAHAKSQLEHVEILLLDSLLPERIPTTLEASLAVDLPALPAMTEPEAPPKTQPSSETASRPKANAQKKQTAPTPVTKPTPESAAVPPTTDMPQPKAIDSNGSKATNTSKGKRQGPNLILPLPAEFVALKKIDAVAHILAETPGVAIHVDHIIERLYGDLSAQDYKAEKVRMKDVMARGVRRGLWKKARVPMSYLIVPPVQTTPAEVLAKPKTDRSSKATPLAKKGEARKLTTSKSKKII